MSSHVVMISSHVVVMSCHVVVMGSHVGVMSNLVNVNGMAGMRLTHTDLWHVLPECWSSWHQCH